MSNSKQELVKAQKEAADLKAKILVDKSSLEKIRERISAAKSALKEEKASK